MKYFWILFSLFILFLSISPCCDDGDCFDAPIIHSTISKNDHKESHHEDLCSPFCICSCCGNHVVNLSSINTSVPLFSKELQEKRNNHYSFQGASKYEASIWQPPQIA